MIDIEKVREALKRLRNGYDDKYYKQFTNSAEKQDEDYNTVLKAITELERLQKKETAMKPVWHRGLTPLTDHAKCPNCYNTMTTRYFAYCESCGQKLDWSDEK
jgi:hypothetical protein